MGGPPQAVAFTATTSASASLISINRYGAAAEWSTTIRPPTSCANFVAADKSVVVPSAADAEATATNRVSLVIKFSHCHVGRSTGLDVDLGPLDLRAVAVCRPQPWRDVRFRVQSADDNFKTQAGTRGRRLGQCSQQHGAISAEHDTTGVGINQISHRLAGSLQNSCTAAGGWMRPAGIPDATHGMPSKQ